MRCLLIISKIIASNQEGAKRMNRKRTKKKKRYDRIKRLLTTGESASLGNIMKKKARYEKEGKR